MYPIAGYGTVLTLGIYNLNTGKYVENAELRRPFWERMHDFLDGPARRSF